MKRILRTAALCAALTLSAAARGQSLPEPRMAVIPPAGSVTWRGISAEEAASPQAPVLYPAPNIGGFLAAIFAHALIVHGSQGSRHSERQAVADKVLEPHARAIADMTPARLVEAAVSRAPSGKRITAAADTGDRSSGTWIEIRPSFALSPDRRVIVLDNAVRIFGAGSKIYFQNIVRVVSTPRLDDDPLKYWTAEDGKALVEVSSELLAHSLDVALAIAVAGNGSLPARTQRYQFGMQERMERGQPVAFACSRVVLRTLRDWLMSVPVPRLEGASPCEDPYRLEPAGMPAS